MNVHERGGRATEGQDQEFSVARRGLVRHARCGRTQPGRCSGEGSDDAEIMLVGEQPADREDPEGRPFVGPAGPLLDKALPEADIERNQVYVTNAVKHFRFEPRGKRRLRKRANASEIKICRRWLTEEIEAVRPRLIVALGATAAQSLAGRATPVGANRGERVAGVRHCSSVCARALGG